MMQTFGSVGLTVDPVAISEMLTAVDKTYHAVILVRDNFLYCFEVMDSNRIEPMTLQISYSEEPARYTASEATLVNRCLPDVVSKIGPRKAPHIALIDTDRLWSHERILEDGIKCNTRRREYSRMDSITIDTYLKLPDEPLVPDYSIVLTPVSENSRTIVGASSFATLRTAASSQSLLKNVKPPEHNGNERITLSSLDDVPAEFDQVVWRVEALADVRNDGLRKRLASAARGTSFTTTEMVAGYHEVDRWIETVKIFRQLRREQGRSIEVPMLGFSGSGLRARGELGLWCNDTVVNISDDEVSTFRSVRYFPFELKGHVFNRILLSAYRCIRAASEGLLLFDLTEDIICELAGKADIKLSFADVLRVYNQMKRVYS